MAVTFRPKVGDIVRHDGERFIILEFKSLKKALCRKLSSKDTAILSILELAPDEDQSLPGAAVAKATDLAAIPASEWTEATKHMDLIRSLVQKGRYHRTKSDIELIANACDKSPKTIYRWLKKYERIGTVDVFISKERNDKGKARLSSEVDAIIQDAIRRLLMKQEYGTYKDAHTEAKRICAEKKLPIPGLTSIRSRFLQISEKDRVAARQGKKAAKEKFTPLMGSFPGADHPLDVIQIDHTPADVIIVDDIYRKPIGRPILTLAIDVFSRMVMGFNIWLEAPSAASVGLCLAHAMLPKDKWLERIGLKAEWECYGRPRKIHTDNAKEFRGTVLGRACKAYGIDLEQRPKGQPQYGGHVERGFRTYLRKIHTLPGTTFSNVKSKFEYDSSGKAIMTLKEFELWFATFLCKKYHVDLHTGIMNTPQARFQEGILGTEGRPGIGLPERFTDEARVRLDFMPFKERTVQEYGVLIDHIYYNDDVLRPRIHEMDPDDSKSARQFIFRRDPADVSVVYFWDPDLKVYREVPTAFRGRPPVALWEVRTVIRELRVKGMANVNENLIFEGIDEMREIERNAAEKTKTARRNEQRRLESEKTRKARQSAPPPKSDFTAMVQAIADDKHRKQKVSATTAIREPVENEEERRSRPTVVPAPALVSRPEAHRSTELTDSLLDDDEEVLPYEDVDMRR